jgi:hypothetical protein
MRKVFSKRNLVIVGLVLLALFVIRPQAARLRWRISQSISSELGRRVEIGSVHFRFLPRPGFELENFVIHDDDAFGAEPFLRSPDVTASLRIAPLFRGRIEISALSLSEASLNLARDQQGKWNLSDLIQRNASINTAPTAAAKHASRPEFPYIEATRSRINFKIGNEKTHFAFTEAQLAVWQESENAWGVRLTAKPIRTDANLTDTGLFSVSGLWQRSPVLNQTPLQFLFEWRQAQVGQASKLVLGSDEGWRGGVLISGTVVGTPAKLQVSARTSIDNFGRYDVFSNRDLQLTANCTAEYGSVARTFSDVECTSPVGDGKVNLTGSVSGAPSSLSYSVSLSATEVPAQAVVAFLRNATGRIPVDLAANGTLNGKLLVHHSDADQQVELQGQGEIQKLKLVSSNTPPMVVETVPVSVASELIPTKVRNKGVFQQAAHVEFGPAAVTLGRRSPLQVRASFSRLGYQASVRGDAGIKRLLESAHSFGIPVPAVAADGNSTVDLTIAGEWAGSQHPTVTGTAKLRSVRARVRGLNAPLQIESADLVLGEQLVRVRNLNAFATDASWRGTLEIPRPCAAADSCNFQFNLHAAEVSASALNQLLNPQAGKKWYRFLPGTSEKSYLLVATASGRIAVDRLVLGNATCTRFSTEVGLRQGKITLSNIEGDLLGGKANGDLAGDFGSVPPTYTGTGNFEGASFSQIAELMHNSWIAGTGSARFHFEAAGSAIRDLLDTTDLTADFAVKDGAFPNIVLTGKSAPLHATAFSGTIALRDGNFSFQDTKLETESSVYKIIGTASLDGALNLKMVGETAAGYNLSGSLAKTRVSQILTSATQASLKP